MAARAHLQPLMAALIAINTLVVLTRLYVRLTITNIGYDDYAIIVALAGFLIMCAFCFVALAAGFGLTDPEGIASFSGEYDAMRAQKYFTISQITYVASFPVVRISVALVLHRLVTKKYWRRMLVGSMAVVGLYSLACLLVDVTQCVPLQATWGEGEGKCLSTASLANLGFAVSALDIASAVTYAVLPVFLVRGTRLSLRTKVSVVFLLGLGAVTVVFSFIRLESLVKLREATSTAEAIDLELESFVYTVLEFGISILTASLAGLRPLVKYLPFGRSSGDNYNKPSNATPALVNSPGKTNTFELSYRKQGFRLHSEEDAETESQRGIVKDHDAGPGLWKHTQYTVSYSPSPKEEKANKNAVDMNGDSD